MSWLLILAGFVALVGGADLLVRGATRLASRLGISSLVIGLTVVAYGTSAPELAVSVAGSLAGAPGLALGNVVGSNICNVLLILGISAVILPLHVQAQLVRVDVPVMIGVTLLVVVFALGGGISRVEGVLLLLAALVYTAVLVRIGRRAGNENDIEIRGGVLRETLFLLVGFTLLVLGSKALVEGSVRIARAFGVSELVIGLTLVALGTSLPELVTSVVAALRGERDIAIGNVVGSNIFNLLVVLGAAGSVSEHGLPVSAKALHFDLPAMTVVAVLCLPVFLTGRRISRLEGALALLAYAAYVTLTIVMA